MEQKTIENKETNIEEVTEEKREKKKFEDYDIGFKVSVIAVGSAVKQLADKNTYLLGLGAGLLLGKKSGLKAMGLLVGVNVIRNTARYLTGDIKIDD